MIRLYSWRDLITGITSYYNCNALADKFPNAIIYYGKTLLVSVRNNFTDSRQGAAT